MKRISFGLGLFFTSVVFCRAEKLSLLQKIEALTVGKNLTLAFSIYDFQTGEQIGLNEMRRCPMQSVFKLPIGIMALDQVDRGELLLEHKIVFSSQNLRPKTWSPIREKYPNGTTLSLLETLDYTIAKSDNNSCDVLLEMLGGASEVESFFKNEGISEINIEVNEVQMSADWENKRKNWITPNSAISLLQKIKHGGYCCRKKAIKLFGKFWQIRAQALFVKNFQKM